MPSILLPGGVLTGRKTLKDHRMPTDQEASEICRGISEAISAIYPGYVWMAMIRGDLLSIVNMSITKKCGFSVPLSAVDPEGKLLMRAGGELLERHKIKRHGGRDLTGMQELKRDIRGNAVIVA